MATNPFEMLKQLQGLQSRMGEMQEKLKTVRVTGSAGGGMVTVEMNGQMRVEKVTIAPEAVDPRHPHARGPRAGGHDRRPGPPEGEDPRRGVAGHRHAGLPPGLLGM